MKKKNNLKKALIFLHNLEDIIYLKKDSYTSSLKKYPSDDGFHKSSPPVVWAVYWYLKNLLYVTRILHEYLHKTSSQMKLGRLKPSLTVRLKEVEKFADSRGLFQEYREVEKCALHLIKQGHLKDGDFVFSAPLLNASEILFMRKKRKKFYFNEKEEEKNSKIRFSKRKRKS